MLLVICIPLFLLSTIFIDHHVLNFAIFTDKDKGTKPRRPTTFPSPLPSLELPFTPATTPYDLDPSTGHLHPRIISTNNNTADEQSLIMSIRSVFKDTNVLAVIFMQKQRQVLFGKQCRLAAALATPRCSAVALLPQASLSQTLCYTLACQLLCSH